MPKAFAMSRRQGRPKKTRPSIDLGTPELIYKRAYHSTMEAIDLCLEHAIITPAQHSCGLHLRWLYTIRYGAPGISALPLTPLYNAPLSKQDDPLWRQARETEYREAIALLKSYHCANEVMRICVHNERLFHLNQPQPSSATNPIPALKEGLSLLAKHWKRNPHNRRDRHQDENCYTK